MFMLNRENIIVDYKLPDIKELSKENDNLVRQTHIAIKKITQDINDEFQFNTVISQYREFTNTIYDYMNKKTEMNEQDKNVLSFALLSMLKMISPVVPYMSEEIGDIIGLKDSIHNAEWPKFDDNLAKMSAITVVTQINGKLKDKLEVDADISKEELEQLALSSEKIKSLLEGKQVVKVIVVPNKLVNIVVK